MSTFSRIQLCKLHFKIIYFKNGWIFGISKSFKFPFPKWANSVGLEKNCKNKLYKESKFLMKIKPILFKVIQQKRNVFKFQDKNVQLKRKKLKNILLKLSVKK